MKYNININQKALEGQGLDLKDAAILDYLYFYCNSKNEKIEEKREDGWTWISYKALLGDMPLLNIQSRNSITPRMQKLVDAGYILTKIKMVEGEKATKKLFVKLTQLMDKLFVENTEAVRETVHNNNTMDDSTIYHSTSDTESPEKDYNSLPENFGENRLKKIIYFYSKLWKGKYNLPYRVNFGLFGKTLQRYDSLTEMQTCALIVVHFRWRGISGTDDFTYKKLDEAGFPFEWIYKNINSYIAHMKNTLELDFEDSEEVYKFVGEELKNYVR